MGNENIDVKVSRKDEIDIEESFCIHTIQPVCKTKPKWNFCRVPTVPYNLLSKGVIITESFERKYNELKKLTTGNIFMICEKCNNLCTAKCGDKNIAISTCCESDIKYLDKRID